MRRSCPSSRRRPPRSPDRTRCPTRQAMCFAVSSDLKQENEKEASVSSSTTTTRIGTREEWLAAREQLLAREKEHTRLGDEIARQRRELPRVPVEKDYRFDTDD